MAQLPSVFNANDHKGRMGFNVIPAGKYRAKLVKSEAKKTKDGQGQYWNLSFKITEGERKGSVIFTKLNLINKSDQAVQIAQNELGSICDACGKGSVRDTEELHGIEIEIDVAIKAADENYPESNTIKGYHKIGGGPSKSASGDAKPAAKRPIFGKK